MKRLRIKKDESIPRYMARQNGDHFGPCTIHELEKLARENKILLTVEIANENSDHFKNVKSWGFYPKLFPRDGADPKKQPLPKDQPVCIVPVRAAAEIQPATEYQYLVKQEDQISGPFNLEGILSLAHIQKLLPTAEIALERDREFKPQAAWPFFSLLYPDKKQKLKRGVADFPKPRGLIEKPEHKKGDPIEEHPEVRKYKFIHSMKQLEELLARDPHSPYLRNLLNTVRTDSKEQNITPEEALNIILKDNTKKLIELVVWRRYKFRISKHTVDFWFMLISVNTLLLYMAILGNNLISIVFGLSGCFFFTAGLWWTMYVVMDKY